MNAEGLHLINGLAGHSWLVDHFREFAARDLVFFAAPLFLALWFWPLPAGTRAANQRIVLATLLAIGLALLLAHFLARLDHDARPFVTDPATRLLIHHTADNSFPSDHASFAFAIGAAIVWRRRLIGGSGLVLALLIGLARIFVGVHWPEDIAAGAITGLLAGTLMAWAVPLLSWPQRLVSRAFPPWLAAPP